MPKILPSKDMWIPGLIISGVAFVLIGFAMKKFGKPAV